jgi:hypothetical protein
MPSLGDIGRVVENDETLDLSASQERDGCDACLPS